MLTIILIIILALVFFSYAAIPLLVPNQADPLPNYQDPIKKELSEERDALLRAIKEIDNRDDLSEERRNELKRRYESKTAKVLRSLDEYSNKAPKEIKISKGKGLPVAVFGLLLLMIVPATILSTFVFPRIGENSTVTTSSVDQLKVAAELKKLQQAAKKEPNEENLMALAEYYWHLQDAENATQAYTQIIETLDPVPAIAAHRLGLLVLQQDTPKALEYFELAYKAEPTNLDTLYALGEVNFRMGKVDKAIKYLEEFLAQPEGSKFEDVAKRLKSFKAISPALNAATAESSDDNLRNLADAYWLADEKELAANIYLNLMKNIDPNEDGLDPQNEPIFSRVGQYFFLKSQTDDAIIMLERATLLNQDDLDALLFLGNAYFSKEMYQPAINVWNLYVEKAGPEEAGRVPSLIEAAQAKLDGIANPEAISGRQIFVSNCATCHGANGEGGAGPKLSANPRAADIGNVENIVKYGRGIMPGFQAKLSEEERALVVDYVTTDLSQ